VPRFALIVISVIAADWAVKLAVGQTGLEQIHNSRPAELWIVPALLVGGSLLVWLVPERRLLTSAAALCVGGGVANILDRALFGPVLDYIPFSWQGEGYYSNLADLAIAAGAILALAGALAVWGGTLRRRPRARQLRCYDPHAALRILRQLERRYALSSARFYEAYSEDQAQIKAIPAQHRELWAENWRQASALYDEGLL
jgi:lipoprotein signal peptidase